MPEEIGRLLLVQPRWMGDVLLCTPAIREARRAFPDARIHFATEASGRDVLRANPNLDEILLLPRGLGRRMTLLREILRRRYDALVDFRSTGSTAMLALASRARVRVGVRGRGPRNAAYTHLLPRQDLTTYAARHKLQLLAPIGVPVQEITDLRLELPIGDEERGRAAEIWRGQGLEGRAVVAITPVSRVPYKQWGAERWARVADRIVEHGVAVLLTHGPGEAGQARSVAAGMRGEAVWDYGPTSVGVLAALLERCLLWVGNDGGAKHVAVAAGVPTHTVSRWQIGPVWTDPDSAAGHTYVDRAPPEGCDLRCDRCHHRGCLAALEADDVLARVWSVLSAPSGRRHPQHSAG